MPIKKTLKYLDYHKHVATYGNSSKENPVKNGSKNIQVLENGKRLIPWNLRLHLRITESGRWAYTFYTNEKRRETDR
jgi:hypothetical protein